MILTEQNANEVKGIEDFPRQYRKRFRSLVFSESLSINTITPFSLSLQAPNPRQPCIHSPWIGSTTEKARSRKIRTARITILRMTTTPRRRRRIGSWRALDPTPWRVSCSPSYSRRLWHRLKKKNKKKMVVAGERNTGMLGFREFWKRFLTAHSWLVLWSFNLVLVLGLGDHQCIMFILFNNLFLGFFFSFCFLRFLLVFKLETQPIIPFLLGNSKSRSFFLDIVFKLETHNQ